MDSFIKALLKGLGDIQISRYAQISSSTIIIFDHLITFGEEIDLIWRSSWSLGKILFLLNRYYSLAAVIFNNYGFFSSDISDTFCLQFLHWQGWTALLACMLAEGILQMRLYALFALNKKILVLLLSFFILSTATSGWIMGTVLSSITAKAISIPTGGKFCVPSGVPKHFYMFWIPLLAYECILCALALIKGFQTFRNRGSLFQNGRHLVAILVRDSLLYFFVICATYLTILLVWLLAPTSLLEVPVGFSVAMSCVLANRVVLNVREISREEIPEFSSQKPIVNDYDASFCSPGSLTMFEMEQLRTMRAERALSDIIEDYEYSTPFVAL